MTATMLPVIRDLPHAEEVDLATLTTMATPGVARLVVQAPDAEALGRLLRGLASAREPFILLGSGTNVIFTRREVRPVIIRLGGGFDFVEATDQEGRLRVGAATDLSQLLGFALSHDLAGLEWTAGIPGTVGGATVGNAGAAGRGMGDIVVAVEGFTRRGEPVALGRDELHFDYRSSNLRPLIVTVLEIALEPGDHETILARVAEHRAPRERHPLGDHSSGCVFRNPRGDAAGRLIEAAGLKGTSLGQAQVSLAHANFIINRGEAEPKDVVALIEHVRQRVAKVAGVQLETEVMLVDPDAVEPAP